jgi:hypothetical protein
MVYTTRVLSTDLRMLCLLSCWSHKFKPLPIGAVLVNLRLFMLKKAQIMCASANVLQGIACRV